MVLLLLGKLVPIYIYGKGHEKALASVADSLNFHATIKVLPHHDKGIISLIGVVAPYLLLREYKIINNMDKKQIFDFIVDNTAQVCRVSADDIRSGCRRADVVDARCIAFCYATEKGGFTPRDIATILGKDDPKAIRLLCQSYQLRFDRSHCFRQLSYSLYALLKPQK